ncbi:hypothetical protein N7465_005609 [Penicillium sp. CMV-2018d]|nr:hypothetical protein N7465_005609 [Penicillium sp. CMV-2018d]
MSKPIENIEMQILSAVEAYYQSNKPNIAKLAREFGVPYSRLRCRINRRKPNSAISSQRKALNPMQERAKNWVYRFIKRLPPEISYITLKPTEKSRDNSENFGALFLWFNKFSVIIKKHQFLPNKIFNWDKTSF